MVSLAFMRQKCRESGTVTGRSSVRQAGITILKFAVSVLDIAFIIWKFGGSNIVGTLQQARLEWLFAALCIFMVSILLSVVQWQILLRNKGISLSFLRAFILYSIGMFFNNLVLGTIAGDAVKVTYIKTTGGSGKAGFAATFLDRLAGLWALSAFAVVGCLVLLEQGATEGGKLSLAIAALFVMFGLFGGIQLFLVSGKLQELLFSVLDKSSFPKKGLIRGIISEIILEAHDVHLIFPVAVLSTIIQFLRVSVSVLCAASLGLLSVGNVPYFFIIVPVVSLLMIVPLPFGVREGVGGTLFALVGFRPEAAMVMGFLASFVGIIASLLGGIFFILDKTLLSRTVHL